MVAQSNATRDFTRKAVIEGIQILDFSFARKLAATFVGSLSRLATMPAGRSFCELEMGLCERYSQYRESTFEKGDR